MPSLALLFSDIEGSTRLLQRHGQGYLDQLAVHQRLARECWARHGGTEQGTEGDSFFVTFATADDAAEAALDAQLSFVRHPWPPGVEIRVRIGVHSGEVLTVGTELAGMTVHEAARIAAAGHGGQVLVSDVVRGAAAVVPPAAWVNLGDHQLKDLPRPLRLWQLSHPELAVSFPPLRSLGTTPHNIPAPTTALVGRVAELADVAALLDDHRVVTVTGAGGAGKTRLALHVAATVLGRFPAGVWLVELATLDAHDSVLGALAAVMALDASDGTEPTALVASHLERGPALVVLDNCEHLVDAVAGAVDQLLRACPHLRVLATSREMLAVEGETAWRLPNLDGEDATRLLVERARAAGATTLDDSDPALGEICRRLDGIPLALELAGARIATLGASEVLARLDRRFRLLTGGRRTALARQRTLQGTIDWSHDLLTGDERALFRVLGVFTGFDLAAVEAVSTALGHDDVVGDLDQLVAKSMVVVESDSGRPRYRLLETLRQYALDRLVDAGGDTASAARRAHATWAASVVRTTDELAAAGRERAATALVRREHQNLVRAVEWAAAEGERSLALGAVAPWWYWVERGLLAEGRRIGELALGVGGDAEVGLVMRAAAVVALTSRGQRDLSVNEGLLAMLRPLVGVDAPGWVHVWLTVFEGLVALDAGDVAGVREAVGRLGTSEAGERDAAFDAWLLEQRANLAELDGDVEHATALRNELLALARTTESTYAACQSLLVVARASTTPAAAKRDLVLSSIERARRDDDPTQEFHGWRALGNAVHDDDHDAALAAFSEALVLARRHRSRTDVAWVLNDIAWWHVVHGDTAEGLVHAEEALGLLADAPARDRVSTLHTLAVAERNAGLAERSRAHFAEVVDAGDVAPVWAASAVQEAREALEAPPPAGSS